MSPSARPIVPGPGRRGVPRRPAAAWCWRWALGLLGVALLISGCVFDRSGLRTDGLNANRNGNDNANHAGPLCGDGLREPTELCDGADLGGRSCADEGFYDGLLACGSDCAAFDTSACVGYCGDNAVNGAELCDGADLGGRTCADEGFFGGLLTCQPGCAAFDTSACTDSCGDDTINGGDLCDGQDLGGHTCADEGFYGGQLACQPDCAAFDASACTGSCGDGLVNGPEACDGQNLGGHTCASLGCRSGTPGCTSGCVLDPAGCTVGHDEDADGVDDSCDDCPSIPNAGQANGDGDQVGDACEAPANPPLLSQISLFEPFTSGSNAWSAEGGTWTVGGDAVTGSGVQSQFPYYTHSLALLDANYGVETTFHLINPTPPASARTWTALLFAFSNNGTVRTYACAYEPGPKRLALWHNGGSEGWHQFPDVIVSTSVLPGQWHRLRVYRIGDAVWCYYDDEAGGSRSTHISDNQVEPNMSGRAGLRVDGEDTVFTSFVIYQ